MWYWYWWEKIATSDDGTEKAPKQIHTNTVNSSLAKVQSQNNEEKNSLQQVMLHPYVKKHGT